MKVALIRAANKVNIDGEPRIVDLSALDPEIHVVRIDTDLESGEIEYVPQKVNGRGNETIDDVSPYQSFIDAWDTAPPLKGDVPDALEAKRVVAQRELEEERLESRATDPDAPQSVKDYITEKRRPAPARGRP